MTTVLDNSQIIPAQRESPMTDTELIDDDERRLQLMEEMLRDRSYSRNQHGFWVAPGSRMTSEGRDGVRRRAMSTKSLAMLAAVLVPVTASTLPERSRSHV